MWRSIAKELGFFDSNLLLCGSSLNEVTGMSTDIDLLCYCSYANYVYSEHLYYQERLIHLIVFPKFKFLDYLICNICTQGHIYANMWMKSQSITNDTDDFLGSLQKYITKILETPMATYDDYSFAQLQKIITLCNNMSSCQTNQLLIASELLLTINRFISGIQCDTKHLARHLHNNNTSQVFQKLFTEAVCTKDYSKFLYETKVYIKRYMPSHNHNSCTTAITYNIIPEGGPLIIFIPEVDNNANVAEAIEELSFVLDKIVGKNYYCFKIEPNQALDAGLYFYIHCYDKVLLSTVYANILQYHKDNAKRFLHNGIKLLYPYRTVFSSGLFFGGFEIQKRLTSIFCNLYSIVRATGCDKLELVLCIYKIFANKTNDGNIFLSSMCDRLAIDAADPIGIYNIELLKTMIETLQERTTFEVYCNTDGSRFSTIRGLIEQLIDYVLSISESEILFPNILIYGNEQKTLLHYILLHIQDIFMLSFPQRYETLRSYLTYKY